MTKKTQNRLNRDFNVGLADRNKSGKEKFKAKNGTVVKTLDFDFSNKKNRIVVSEYVVGEEKDFIKEDKRGVNIYKTLPASNIKKYEFIQVRDAINDKSLTERLSNVKNKGKLRRLIKVANRIASQSERAVKLLKTA